MNIFGLLAIGTLALQENPARLTDTPEWQALRAQVLGAGSLKVSYVLESSASATGTVKPRESLTIDGKGRTFLANATTLTFSDANATVAIDRKTGERIGGVPLAAKFGFFAFLGFVSAETLGLEPTTLTRLTTQTLGPDGSAVTRVGWSWSESWIDTLQTFEVWFDPTTQFVDKVITESSGMTLPMRRVYRFIWVVGPTIPANYFVPKFIPIERPTPPPETGHYRFVRSPSWSEGFGRIVVRLPKGINGEIEIKGRTSAKTRGNNLVITLPVSPHIVATDYGTQAVRVAEGYDTVVKFGVMQLRGNTRTVISRDGHEVVTLSKTRRTVALFPGKYRVKSAGSSRTVRVVEGSVIRI